MTDIEVTKSVAEFSLGNVHTGAREAQVVSGLIARYQEAAFDDASIARMRSVVDSLAPESDEASVWHGADRQQAEWAAFLNAFALGSSGACRGEAGTVVIPVAAAVAELNRSSAKEFLEAVLVGLEVAERVRRSLGETHETRGWDVVGTTGAVASAAVSCRLLGLDLGHTEQALGLAATQAAGLAVQAGTPAIALHPAKASFNGIEASRLVLCGLDGPRRILEGRRGLYALASDDPDPSAAVAELGTRWLGVEAAGHEIRVEKTLSFDQGTPARDLLQSALFA